MEIVRVKKITDEIVDVLARLIPQLGENYVITEALLNDVIASDNNWLLLAKEGGRIVGTLTLVSYIIPTGAKAWIEDVVVDESARGSGVGERLILEAIAYAKARGIRKIDLSSRPERLSANRLYQKIGFQIRETNMYRLKENS